MYSSIVVGTDGTATSRAAVDHAIALAQATGATLHLVHAYRMPSAAALASPEIVGAVAFADGDAVEAAKGLMEGAVVDVERRGVASVQSHVRSGGAADALCSVAKEVGADVIVVGNKGMKGARRVLGSVPNSVAHHAGCAVLIVNTS